MKKEGGGLKKPLEQEVANKLLQLLSTDNAFRRSFKKDPSSALAQLGHSAPVGEPACRSIAAIAPKKELAASSVELAMHLTGAGPLTNPHCFEAGKVASSLRRK